MLARTRIAIIVSTAIVVAGTMLARRAVNRSTAANDAASKHDGVGAEALPVHEASAIVAAFLEASRDGSPTGASVDTLLCRSSQRELPIAMIGAYDVLPGAPGAGDTVIVRAGVTTVAEQDRSRSGSSAYVGRIRVRVDTLEWDVFRDEGGRLVVCNGLQFGFRGDTTSIEWRSPSESYQRARALADSVYAAHQRTPR